MSDNSSSFGIPYLDSTVYHSTMKDGDPSPLRSKRYRDVEDIMSRLTPETSRADDRSSSLNGDNKEHMRSVLRKHPELEMASRDGKFNPVKGARVMFSPSKEILQYKEMSSDLQADEFEENPIPQDKESQGSTSSAKIFFLKLATDPMIPYVLSLYLQLFLNLFIISIMMYFVFLFIRTVRADINQKIEIYATDALEEISLCTREFYRNKCVAEEGKTRAPALERACTAWGKCMNRDPQLIGRSKITAETFSDIVNGFVRPISWKSLFFINILVLGSLFVTNLAFGRFRSSSETQKIVDSRNNSDDKLRVKCNDLENLVSSLQRDLKNARALSDKAAYVDDQERLYYNDHLATPRNISYQATDYPYVSNDFGLSSPLLHRRK